MTDVIELEVHRALKEAAGMLDALRRETEATLESMLVLDVSHMDGPQLLSIRDGCMKMRWILAIAEPDVQLRISDKMVEMGGRLLTHAEVIACVPSPPKVTFG